LDATIVITPEQAAKALGLSVSTLAKLRLSGGGPAYCKVGARRVGYRPDDLQSWLASRVHRSTSEYEQRTA
jgi:predicted DNA-binding transcriptional regulator AlpA